MREAGHALRDELSLPSLKARVSRAKRMKNKSMPNVGEPVVTWRQWGTMNYSGWIMGERVNSLAELKAGEYYLEDKKDLSLLNMVKVRIPEDGVGIMALIAYVRPSHAPEALLGNTKEWAVWQSHFENDNKVAFYRVHREVEVPVLRCA
jgi:hypothetical protein